MSIDPASNLAGVSLWLNGRLTGTTVLKSNSSSDSYSRRLQTQVPQLTAFLASYLSEGECISKVIFEGVRARLVLVSVGAFLTCPYIDAKISPTSSFIESSTWKYYARANGARGDFADIKGVAALKEIGIPVEELGITSDDIADSILIYLAWYYRRT